MDQRVKPPPRRRRDEPCAHDHDGDQRDEEYPPLAPAMASLLVTIIHYLISIRTWQRTGIALVLGGAFLCATLIYKYPDRVFEFLSVASRPALRRPPTGTEMTYFSTEVQVQLDRLLGSFGPELIGVLGWRVDMEGNTMRLVAWATRSEYAPALRELAKGRWSYPEAAFGDLPKVNDLLAQLYVGRFACTTPEGTWPALARFPLAELCLIGIPPGGLALSGFLAGGWRTPLEGFEKVRAEAAFRAAASALVWRSAAENRALHKDAPGIPR